MKAIQLFISFIFFSVYLFGQKPTVKDSVGQFSKQGIVVLNTSKISTENSLLDSITMVKTGLHYSFFYNNRKLRYPDVKKILITNEEARKYVGFANTNRITSNIFFGSGVIAICFTAIISIDRKDPSYFYRGAIMGGAFIIISIPLQIGFTKNMRKATDIYNSGLNLAYNHNDFNLQITSNGFGLVFRL